MPDTANRRLMATVAMALVAALVLVTIVYFIADAATDNLLVDRPGSDEPQDVGLAVVLVNTVLGTVVGLGLAMTINRLAPAPRATFIVVSAIGLVFYGLLPFEAAEETSTAIWLNVMHIAVAIPVVGSFAAYLPAARGLR